MAVMVALILWAKAPDYRTLFSNLSDQDGGAIVSQLTQMNVCCSLPLQRSQRRY
ncbi:hypothetical protein ACLB1Q_02230 [Escherichia coli]